MTNSTRAGPVFVLGILGTMMLAAVFFAPGPHSIFPDCPFLRWTGLYCPGCGFTRMLHHLVHGEVGLALKDNALALFCLPLLVALPLQALLPARYRFPIRPARPALWVIGLVIIIVAFTIARNIPAWPYCTLAPGGC